MVALTIAGSDPSGGAGLQADLKTFHQFGVFGQAIPTLITVQNSFRAGRVKLLSADLVREQIEAVLEDVPPAAVKTGALGSEEIVRAVAEAAGSFAFPLVVDPVRTGKQGSNLADDRAFNALRSELLPRAALVTPNVPEAEALSGIAIHHGDDMRRAAEAIHGLGAKAVLIKGGHLPGNATDVIDLGFDGVRFREFSGPRIATRHTHGTGCTYSAAITAGLARGDTLWPAVARARAFIQEAIRTAPGLGRGAGPVNHHAAILENPMTKMEKHFRLLEPLDEAMMSRLERAHALYGIFKIQVAPSLDSLLVEYDASRLRPAEVDSALARAGVPVEAA